MTFWDKFNPKFQVPVEEQVPTEQFLLACQQTLPVFDMLGKAFSIFKKDVSGNVDTLLKKFLSNPVKCATIKELLQDEFDNGMTANKPTNVALACLWLKRAMEFMCFFLKYMEEDYRNEETKEDISGFAQQAYKETLKKYHGWVLHKAFSLVSRAIPYRKDAVKSLCLGDITQEANCYDQTREFVNALSANCVVIAKQLQEFNLDSDATTNAM